MAKQYNPRRKRKRVNYTKEVPNGLCLQKRKVNWDGYYTPISLPGGEAGRGTNGGQFPESKSLRAN